MGKIFEGIDGKFRCSWCSATTDYITYHDVEWGFPVSEDQRLFEKICLEGFQSGLSWRTILSKRDNFRRCFLDFDFNKVAEFSRKDVDRLLRDSSIIRHRGKIEATINNAKRAKELIREKNSLAAYFWSFEPDSAMQGMTKKVAMSPESESIAKDLKKRGWRFVGPTTVYAFMQAMGLVNGHAEGCVMRSQVAAARAKFELPAS